MPVRSQNDWGSLNASEAEIKSAASRRVRKLRGEQPRSIHSRIRHNRTVSSNILAVRVNVDYCRERILTNCACLRGRKGEAVIWPSKFLDQRPGTGVWQAGQSPCAVSLYFWIEYP